MGSLPSLLRLNFPWPQASWPAGPSEKMASLSSCFSGASWLPVSPALARPAVSSLMVKVVVALVGASDQSQQRPENRVTEGWGRRGSSFQPAEAAAFRPPSCSCLDGDSGPDHSLGSQDFSHYQLPPTLCSALPLPTTPNSDLCSAGDICKMAGWG